MAIGVLECHVLLALRSQEPSRSLRNYRQSLLACTGKDVSESTISRFFNKGFPHKGSLQKPNLVPYDKFRPENVAKAAEYLYAISKVSPWRLKFTDAKHYCGSDLFLRKNRADPLTGEVPPTPTDSDFRNTYNVFGFMSIDRRTSPFCYFYATENADSLYFSTCLEKMIANNQLLPYDILVLDNWKGHVGGDNSHLQDFLWDIASPYTGMPMRILLLFLPARAPELNPIEKVWNVTTGRLKSYPLHGCRGQNHAVLYAVVDIMSHFTYEDMEKQYRSCGYIP